MFAFDDATRWILGRPNFWCARYAVALRKLGHVIPEKAEEEQAAVLYWLLCLYEKHGEKWTEAVDEQLRSAANDD